MAHVQKDDNFCQCNRTRIYQVTDLRKKQNTVFECGYSVRIKYVFTTNFVSPPKRTNPELF